MVLAIAPTVTMDEATSLLKLPRVNLYFFDDFQVRKDNLMTLMIRGQKVTCSYSLNAIGDSLCSGT